MRGRSNNRGLASTASLQRGAGGRDLGRPERAERAAGRAALDAAGRGSAPLSAQAARGRRRKRGTGRRSRRWSSRFSRQVFLGRGDVAQLDLGRGAARRAGGIRFFRPPAEASRKRAAPPAARFWSARAGRRAGGRYRGRRGADGGIAQAPGGEQGVDVALPGAGEADAAADAAEQLGVLAAEREPPVKRT